jgi:hypothetical protein
MDCADPSGKTSPHLAIRLESPDTSRDKVMPNRGARLACWTPGPDTGHPSQIPGTTPTRWPARPPCGHPHHPHRRIADISPAPSASDRDLDDVPFERRGKSSRSRLPGNSARAFGWNLAFWASRIGRTVGGVSGFWHGFSVRGKVPASREPRPPAGSRVCRLRTATGVPRPPGASNSRISGYGCRGSQPPAVDLDEQLLAAGRHQDRGLGRPRGHEVTTIVAVKPCRARSGPKPRAATRLPNLRGLHPNAPNRNQTAD